MRINLARHAAVVVITICLSCAAAMGSEPMTATVRVSSGDLYDYVVVGEHSKATDGYDNAYDTISPGNLNADMGQPFISAAIHHPDWKQALRELRGDLRPVAKKQQWLISIRSSLAKGTPLAVSLQSQRSGLPQAVKLILRDQAEEIDLRAEDYTIPAPGPGKTVKIIVIAEQP